MPGKILNFLWRVCVDVLLTKVALIRNMLMWIQCVVGVKLIAKIPFMSYSGVALRRKCVRVWVYIRLSCMLQQKRPWIFLNESSVLELLNNVFRQSWFARGYGVVEINGYGKSLICLFLE